MAESKTRDVACGRSLMPLAGTGDLERRPFHNHFPETVLYSPYDQLPHGRFH